MTICLNCKTENRPGAKFCMVCGANLSEIKSGDTPLANREEGAPEARPSRYATKKLADASPYATTKLAQSPAAIHANTQPLSHAQVFNPRPTGAVFGKFFINDRLVFSNEQVNRYIVRQPPAPAEQRIRACPNPACGAVYIPTADGPIRYCTDCNTQIAEDQPALVLVETLSPLYDHVTDLVQSGLAQSSVRPPLVAFSEALLNTIRYCLVVPDIQGFSRPEPSKALRWGSDLARGLNYLHLNGIYFRGQVNESAMGMVGDRAVWANFADALYNADWIGQAHPDDVKSLAYLLFQWATGRAQPVFDPNLPASVNNLFERAITKSEFASGDDLAAAIEQAVTEASAAVLVDLRLGRRTSVGMQRTLNEDSLLTLEANRIQQSVGQPMGVYVVADGMGGHAAGEVASGTIVNVISQKAALELFRSPSQPVSEQDRIRWVHEVVEAANSAVFDMRKAAGTDMGSTLVMALVEGCKAYITNVGDSRAYRVSDRGIEQLTTDHSLVQRLIAMKQITPEEARHHPQRNVIYRTVGDKPKVELDILTHQFSIGDRLLLCSDGLSGMVEDAYIQKIVMESPNPQAAADALIDAANAAGGEDNITVIVVEIVKG